MWLVNAIIIHVVLLGSIFVIYFRSPVISGLNAQLPLSVESPARRLVLIVTDGLRAESFFRNGCADVPHLGKLMLQTRGLVGISHTRVPTESRPGHIALIAGLYEDPSAVTRGWKHNPVDFDTVFNRSRHTYAWGANDVLHIFSRLGADSERRLLIDTYDHELDFSGRDKTYELDEWVFQHVRLLLARKGAELRNQTQIVFFLHLLGLDSAGHIHKPGTEKFLENLHRTDRGIWEIYHEFERIFPDGRTAYVLTSDHGMTNAGSHGASDPLETETPFFLWGAGITHAQQHSVRTFQIGNNVTLPLYSMEQAQVAPLMSALIGVAPPMNNFGILPLEYLNATKEYRAHAAHSNALQLLEQYKALLMTHERGYFSAFLRSFSLSQASIVAYITKAENSLKERQYSEIINESYKMMLLALHGIDYYHSYYRVPLLICTAATFAGWIMYCMQVMHAQSNAYAKSSTNWRSMCSSKQIIVLLTLFVLLHLQNVPFAIAVYLMLPVFTWLFLVQKQHTMLASLRHVIPLVPLLIMILCAELLVFSFFERKLISLGYLLFGALGSFNGFTLKGVKFYFWLTLVLSLALFPLLPPSVGYTNTTLLLLGMIVTMVRSLIVKSHVDWRVKLINGSCLMNGLLAIYYHTQHRGVPIVSQAISWLFLIYTFAIIMLSETAVLKQRIELIFSTLTILYALFCTSYEPLFIVMLATELMLALSGQVAMVLPLQHTDKDSPAKVKKAFTTKQLQTSFQLAFAILLYTLFSFFGTGNIASVSSFDPNIIRCFLSTFSPFIIMALVILKLIIPVILNICIIFGMSPFARANEQQIFICLLLICDVMGLNFLFMVRNTGSWLEIGTSISHFVIMEVTTLVLLVFTYVAKLLLRLKAV